MKPHPLVKELEEIAPGISEVGGGIPLGILTLKVGSLQGRSRCRDRLVKVTFGTEEKSCLPDIVSS
jgi:hypothetical protein